MYEVCYVQMGFWSYGPDKIPLKDLALQLYVNFCKGD